MKCPCGVCSAVKVLGARIAEVNCVGVNFGTTVLLRAVVDYGATV